MSVADSHLCRTFSLCCFHFLAPVVWYAKVAWSRDTETSLWWFPVRITWRLWYPRRVLVHIWQRSRQNHRKWSLIHKHLPQNNYGTKSFENKDFTILTFGMFLSACTQFDHHTASFWTLHIIVSEYWLSAAKFTGVRCKSGKKIVVHTPRHTHTHPHTYVHTYKYKPCTGPWMIHPLHFTLHFLCVCLVPPS